MVVPRLRNEWFSSARFPVEALDYLLKNGTGGKLLTDYNNGSYALWRLYPQYKVSLDGRFDGVYPLTTIDLVQDAFTGNFIERENAIKTVQPDYVFLPPSDLQEPPKSCAPWYQGTDGRILKCFFS